VGAGLCTSSSSWFDRLDGVTTTTLTGHFSRCPALLRRVTISRAIESIHFYVETSLKWISQISQTMPFAHLYTAVLRPGFQPFLVEGGGVEAWYCFRSRQVLFLEATRLIESNLTTYLCRYTTQRDVHFRNHSLYGTKTHSQFVSIVVWPISLRWGGGRCTSNSKTLHRFCWTCFFKQSKQRALLLLLIPPLVFTESPDPLWGKLTSVQK
jgi:hypothetical protein